MQDCKPISIPFPTNVKLSSKMNIAHAVGVVSRYMVEPGREHWEAVKRILRYIKGTSDVALCFGESDLIVKGYVDSDYAGDLDGSKSTIRYVFTLYGRIVSWVSKLQLVVAMSTMEAEYIVVAQASKETESSISFKDKAYTSSIYCVRVKVEEGTVDMQKIHTNDNVADYLTKAINGDKFIWCRSSCGLAETVRIFRVDRIEVRGTMQGVQVELVMGELITELAMQIQVKQEYFKDKMLLMQAKENGVALDEEQLLFIAADDCDAFNSDVDETPPAQTMFMANLSSADPAYDEAIHEMHDDVQPNYVVDSHADYTSDSNMIPYDQYVKDNAVPVVQSNVSYVPNDAYMMILNDMHEQSAKCVSVTTQINVVDKSLNAELATYKEQVELYERQAKFELTERE
ncbi:hypothetical protein Tco_1362681 [Tanacetum coccineum]